MFIIEIKFQKLHAHVCEYKCGFVHGPVSKFDAGQTDNAAPVINFYVLKCVTFCFICIYCHHSPDKPKV